MPGFISRSSQPVAGRGIMSVKKPTAKSELRRLDVRPSKRRGQNFTIDPSVVRTIAEFGAVRAGESLVEIGPGLGALTERLVEFGPLTVIEIESAFAASLTEKFPSIKVISEDVRNVDFSTLGSDLVVFGNLPYSFSTDIVFHLLGYRTCIKRAVLLLQREFVERLAAPPGGRDYGSLTVAVQLWADVKSGPVVPGTVFHPPTAVESQVVELRFLRDSRVPIADPVWFERVVRAAFNQRRKMLLNTLRSLPGISREQIVSALESVGISPQLRAETLSISQFAAMADALQGVRT